MLAVAVGKGKALKVQFPRSGGETLTDTKQTSDQDQPQSITRPAPVSAANRFESLDVLRGVAVLGILMVNAAFFFMYWGVQSYPPAHMSVDGANATAWLTMHVFFELKFVTLFSCLFGAGIMLMVGDEPNASLKLHYSRMRWLLAIGLIHGFVFWFGDILTSYAIIGMIAVFFRRMSAAKLVLWGLVGIALTNALLVVQGWAATLSPQMYEPAPFGPVPDADTLEMWVGAYQAGFLQSRPFNAIGNAVALLSQLIAFTPRLLGVMLIGMALFKSGFLLARWSARSYAISAAVTLIPGLGALWWSGTAVLASGFSPDALFTTQSVNAFASLAVAFGYASVIMLVCKAPWMKLIRLPFAAAGRMAFTNYLSQTGVMVFIGTGLGLFGTLERVEQVQIVVLIWIAQLIISPIWLSVFRFGPAEWLWRSLSYGKLQPVFRARS
jgi:uncharacterized protein